MAVQGLDGTGVPTLLTNPAGANQGENIAVSPTTEGRIYNYNYHVSGNREQGWDIDPITGIATQLSGAPFQVGNPAFGDGDIKFRPDGKFIYRASDTQSVANVDIITIDGAGNLILCPPLFVNQPRCQLIRFDCTSTAPTIQLFKRTQTRNFWLFPETWGMSISQCLISDRKYLIPPTQCNHPESVVSEISESKRSP